MCILRVDVHFCIQLCLSACYYVPVVCSLVWLGECVCVSGMCVYVFGCVCLYTQRSACLVIWSGTALLIEGMCAMEGEETEPLRFISYPCVTLSNDKIHH